MRRFIAICGQSATGKKTLLLKLIEPANSALRRRFGIEDPYQAYGRWATEIPCPDEIMCVSRLDEATAQTVLFWWQCDTHRRFLNHILVHPGEFSYRVLLMSRPEKEMVTTLAARKGKGRWDTTPENLEQQRRREFEPKFHALAAQGVSIEPVLAVNDGYEIGMAWSPPEGTGADRG